MERLAVNRRLFRNFDAPLPGCLVVEDDLQELRYGPASRNRTRSVLERLVALKQRDYDEP